MQYMDRKKNTHVSAYIAVSTCVYSSSILSNSTHVRQIISISLHSQSHHRFYYLIHKHGLHFPLSFVFLNFRCTLVVIFLFSLEMPALNLICENWSRLLFNWTPMKADSAIFKLKVNNWIMYRITLVSTSVFSAYLASCRCHRWGVIGLLPHLMAETL